MSNSDAAPLMFVSNAVPVAREKMKELNPGLADRFVKVIEFLSCQPGLASAGRGEHQPAVGSVAYVERLGSNFVRGRDVRGPEPPSTIPDEMVSLILIEYFGIKETDVERAKIEHQLAMASENIVGKVLEHYIASVIESHGWVWCSGDMVLAVDFIKAPSDDSANWRMLQVKNRSNTENSSSSRVRTGTTIEKWYRMNADTGVTRWHEFPDAAIRSLLSEADFKKFVSAYLKEAAISRS